MATYFRKYRIMKADSDVKNVLTEDGLPKEALKTFHQYENQTTVNIDVLRRELGMTSWAVRIAYNDRFGGDPIISIYEHFDMMSRAIAETQIFGPGRVQIQGHLKIIFRHY